MIKTTTSVLSKVKEEAPFLYSSIKKQNNACANQQKIYAIPNDILEHYSFSVSSVSNENKKQNKICKQENNISFYSNEEIFQQEEEKCNNDYERNDCFIKLKLEEWNASFYTLITIGSSLMYHDRIKLPKKDGIVITNITLYNATINFSLVITSLSVLLFSNLILILVVMSSINRYLILLKLNKARLKIQKNTTLWNIHYLPWLLLECIVAVFHPNILCKGLYFSTNVSWFLLQVKYEINDFLVLVVIFRVYVIFRLVFSITMFYSSRSARIAQLLGTKLTRVFAIKCLIVVHPFYLLTIVGLFMVVLLSFMLKILEGQTFNEEEPIHDFRQLQNCLWNILVTMTTVGYGDYYPITNFGRIVNVLASIGGSCLISLLTLSLQNALSFRDYEAKAFRTREKELMKEDIEFNAGKYFKSSFQYLLARKKFREERKKQIVNRKEREKTKKEMEKALYEKIEKKRKFRDTIQFFRNIYDIPTETDILKSKMEEFQEDLTCLNLQTNDLRTLIQNIVQVTHTQSNKTNIIANVSSSALLNFSSG